MNAAIDPDDAVAARIAERHAAGHRAVIEAMSIDDLALLALPPLITPAVIERVVDGSAAWLARIRPLLESAPTDDDDELQLSAAARRAIDARILGGGGATWLVGRVAERLAPAELSPTLAQWVALAGLVATDIFEAAQQLQREVRDACEAGAPGAVIDRVDAAVALGAVCGEPLASAARIGRYRIARALRARIERVEVEQLVPRPRAMAALATLLDGSADANAPWALHYVGVGGVGKTCLIRHLMYVVAPARKLTVARIDFDHLSPQYPGRDPGRLIEAIAHELVASIDNDRQDDLYRQVAQQLTRLRDVARVVDHRTDALGPMAWPELSELITIFIAFVDSLPAPVIVLDTCEELTKLDPVGVGRIPSVEATFHLLERVQAKVKRLRVVLAGRRLLCRGGANYQASDAPPWAPLSDARTYLALHELRGFDEHEADALMTARIEAGRPQRDALIGAIKARCPEEHRVEWLARDGAPGPHYAPFELSTYADWVRRDPAVDVATLTAGDLDPYIEQRIVRRMGALEGVVPVVVALRRFDAATLATVVGADLARIRPQFEALAGHEWLHYTDEPGRGPVLEVKPGLGMRLERWLAASSPAAWTHARAKIARTLTAQVRATGMLRGPADVINAALRAVPDLDAAALWLDLERQAPLDLASVENLTRTLLGTRGAAESADNLLGAAVRATRCAALIATAPEVDVGPQWAAVDATATRFKQAAWVAEVLEATRSGAEPFEEFGLPGRLATRARLGAFAASAWRSGSEQADVAELEREIDLVVHFDQVVPLECSIIAAVEAMVERLERTPQSIATARWIDRLQRLPLSTSGLRAFVDMLCARIALLVTLAPDADNGAVEPRGHLELLDAALRGCDGELPAYTLDWRPPTSLRHRLHLHALALSYPERAGLELAESLARRPFDLDDDDAIHLAVAIDDRLQAARFGPRVFTIAPTPARAAGRTPELFARFSVQAWCVAAARDGFLPLTSFGTDWESEALARAAWTRTYRNPSALDAASFRITPHSPAALAVSRARAVLSGAILDDPEVFGDEARLLARRPEQAVHPLHYSRWLRTRCRLLGVDVSERQPHRLRGTRHLHAQLTFQAAQVAPRDEQQRAAALYRWAADAHVDGADADGWLAAQLGRLEVELQSETAWSAGDHDLCVTIATGATPERMTAMTHLLRIRNPDAFQPFARQLLARYREGPALPLIGPNTGQMSTVGPTGTGPGPMPSGGYNPGGELPTINIGGDPVPSSSPRRWPKAVAIGLLGVLLLAVIVVVGSGFGEKGAVPNSGGSEHMAMITNPWAAVVIGSVLAMIAAVVGGVRWWRGRRASAVPPPPWGGPSLLAPTLGPLQFVIIEREGARAVAYVKADPDHTRVLADVSERGAWPSLTAGRTSALTTAVTTAANRTALSVDVSLQPYAWEATLGAAASAHLNLWRLIPRYKVASAPNHYRFHGPAGLGWPSDDAVGAAHPFAMVHAIGRPVREAATVRLDAGGGSRDVSSEPLRAASLVDDDGCIVLQGFPIGAVDDLTDAYRIEVGYLRELAATMIEAGAQVVLLLPPLPLPMTRTLIATLAARFTELRRKRDRNVGDRAAVRRGFIALAAAARAHLASTPSVIARDAGPEITLFIADDGGA